MSLAEKIRRILGFAPPETGILDNLATHAPVPEKSAEGTCDELAEFEITEDYQRVIELIDAEVPVIFVTGRAGTGKSTFIRFIRKNYPGQVAIVAPTGVAAMNAGGVTIHSFFRIPPKVLEPTDIKRVDDNRLYKALRILVVDEVSMVRADILDGMDQFLRLNRERSDLAFGGVQVVLVGDLAQLPPVVGSGPESILFTRRYKSPFFFSSEVLSECVLAPVELTRVFRQTDVSFVDILSRIRLGDATDRDLATINLRTNQGLPVPAPLVLTPTNASADEINRNGLASIEGEAVKYQGCIQGDFKLDEDRLPSPILLQLKINARVMFTRNDAEKRWVNGTLGRVVALSSAQISVELDETGRGIVDVSPCTWEHYRYRYDEVKERVTAVVIGSYTQFPLQLAWAVTIHKAQGKTLDSVHIDLGNGAFAAGQTYVALSRARSLQSIWLESPIRSTDVFPDERILEFYRKLFQRRGAHDGDDIPMDWSNGQRLGHGSQEQDASAKSPSADSFPPIPEPSQPEPTQSKVHAQQTTAYIAARSAKAKVRPSERILEYQTLARMITVLPCETHAMMLSKACEEDSWGASTAAESESSNADRQAQEIISWIVQTHWPKPSDSMEKLFSHADKILTRIREYRPD